MSSFVFANNVNSTLAAPVSSGATSITLSSSANFPTIPSGFVWAITLNDAATQLVFEIVYVTAYSGATCTVLRAQEGTTAHSWLASDLAYAAETAAAMNSYVQGGGQFVQLSPGARQTGFISVNGIISTSSSGAFGAGVAVGGPITTATTGAFSSDVTALDFLASRAYANTALAALPIRVNGSTGVIGIGPSSGLTAFGAVTATALAIGLAGSSSFIAIDINGNLAATNNIYGSNGIFSTEVIAPEIVQGAKQVTDTITSTTLAVTQTNGHTYAVELSATLPVGAVKVTIGNGGDAIIALPNYGTWALDLTYGVVQTNNANSSFALTVTTGTLTSYGTNAQGHTSFNAANVVTMHANGSAVGNQTITIHLAVGGAALSPSPSQPWTFKAIRIA